MLKIREAKESDLKILDYFQDKIGKVESKINPLIKKSGKISFYSNAFLKKVIKSKNGMVLIAEMNDRPVGCCLSDIRKIEDNWCKYKHYGRIGILFIAKDYRKKGIGKELLKNILSWLKKRKITYITLSVIPKNKSAIKLYEKLGFETSLLEMNYKID